jgi:LysR family transcriptional regulator for metE and metH
LHAELELRRGAFRERPKLRVATQCYTAYHWLPGALRALMTEHPEVELVLQGDVVGDANEQLRDDHTDLVLCVIPPRKGAYQRVALFKDELMLAVPRGHALARKKYVEGTDLTEETLIQNNVSTLVRDHMKEVLFGAHGRVKQLLRLPVTEAVLDLVQAGVGVSILPKFAFGARVQRGEIEAVPLTRRGFPRTWSGVFRKRSRLDGPIRTLLTTLKRHGLPHPPH